MRKPNVVRRFRRFWTLWIRNMSWDFLESHLQPCSLLVHNAYRNPNLFLLTGFATFYIEDDTLFFNFFIELLLLFTFLFATISTFFLFWLLLFLGRVIGGGTIITIVWIPHVRIFFFLLRNYTIPLFSKYAMQVFELLLGHILLANGSPHCKGHKSN